MPTSATMKSAMQSYIDAFNSGSAETVVALFDPDATVENPVGTPLKHGGEALLSFYRYSISTGAKLSLNTPIRGSHGDAAAMAFSAKIGSTTVRVIDVMTFNEQAKFAPESSRASSNSRRSHGGPEGGCATIRSNTTQARAMTASSVEQMSAASRKVFRGRAGYR